MLRVYDQNHQQFLPAPGQVDVPLPHHPWNIPLARMLRYTYTFDFIGISPSLFVFIIY